MIKTGFALTTGALLVAGLGVPQAAVAAPADPSAVQNVKVKMADGCVNVKWKMPEVDSGDTFGIIIRTKDFAEFHRIETYKLHASKCGLKSKAYRVQVRQYGGSWVKLGVAMR